MEVLRRLAERMGLSPMLTIREPPVPKEHLPMPRSQHICANSAPWESPISPATGIGSSNMPSTVV